MTHIVVISPPFYSHAKGLLALSVGLRESGARVTFACSREFKSSAAEKGLEFVELDISSNRNTGIATATVQPAEERTRLLEYLEATKAGAVAALLAQTRHREKDMLAAPEATIRQVASLVRRTNADWYLVDYLSFAVTVALHSLRQRFATFCGGHPVSIPRSASHIFGVPPAWPTAISPGRKALETLRAEALTAEREFTAVCGRLISSIDPAVPPIERVFTHVSRHAVVFDYPPGVDGLTPSPHHVYAGHLTFPPAPLPDEWQRRLARSTGRTRILVALGTFHSAREDVLRAVVAGVRDSIRGATLIVAAGERRDALAELAGPDVIVDSFVPQESLLRQVDVMIHHGGNNSFIECAAAAVPAVILPFGADQFSIARDGERLGVARVLDPNRSLRETIGPAIVASMNDDPQPRKALADRVHERGPLWASRRLWELMG